MSHEEVLKNISSVNSEAFKKMEFYLSERNLVLLSDRELVNDGFLKKDYLVKCFGSEKIPKLITKKNGLFSEFTEFKHVGFAGADFNAVAKTTPSYEKLYPLYENCLEYVVVTSLAKLVTLSNEVMGCISEGGTIGFGVAKDLLELGHMAEMPQQKLIYQIMNYQLDKNIKDIINNDYNNELDPHKIRKIIIENEFLTDRKLAFGNNNLIFDAICKAQPEYLRLAKSEGKAVNTTTAISAENNSQAPKMGLEALGAGIKRKEERQASVDNYPQPPTSKM